MDMEMESASVNITTYPEAWIPESHISQHDGSPIPHHVIFYAPPPKEIGIVLTAQSNLQPGRRSRQIYWGDLWSALPIGIMSGGGLSLGLIALVGLNGLAWGISGIIGILLCETIVKWNIIKRPPIICSYVGDQGVAYYEWRSGNIAGNCLEFSQVRAIKRSVVKKFLNNTYQKTLYSFTWEQSRFMIIGSHWSLADRPPRGDHYYFAIAAERIWTDICLQRSQAELDRSGILRFDLTSGEAIKLEPGFLTLISKPNQSHRFSASEIQIESRGGEIIIHHIDPSKGLIRADGLRHGSTISSTSMNTADLYNANAFLTLATLLLKPGHSEG
jgi:hypothetical protein